MKSKTIITYSILLVLFSFSYWLGHHNCENQFIERSLNLEEKQYFTNRDIEHILFNEPLPTPTNEMFFVWEGLEKDVPADGDQLINIRTNENTVYLNPADE